MGVFPPVEEQLRIVSHLEEVLSRYAGLESEAAKGIELMKERRSALISAAVTGKIDVRTWQPVDCSTTEEYLQAAEQPPSYA